MTNMNNLSFVRIFTMQSNRNKTTRCRAENGFLCKISGVSEFDFGDRVITLSAGEVLYLPKGCSYHVRLISEGESHHTTLFFRGDIFHGLPYLFQGIDSAWLVERLDRITRLQLQEESLTAFLSCQSLLYEIAAALASRYHDSIENMSLYQRIKPAVTYIHENMFDSSLNLSDVEACIDMSGTSFRAAFRELMGMSPKEYITAKRMAYAKDILCNGDYNKICDVAATCGYADALYFGKVFKSFYGISPQGYQKKSR